MGAAIPTPSEVGPRIVGSCLGRNKMTDYYVATLGLTRAEDLYISFRRFVRSDGVCWPLPWAGTWSEAAVVRAAAELNDGVESTAVPKDVVHALATEPAAGRIDGDVGPVVRNSASNRRALVVAARRDIARMEAVEIPLAGDSVRGDEDISKALRTLLPLLGRKENLEDDRLWRLRADLLAALHSDDRRRGLRAVQAVNAIAGGAEATSSEKRIPPRLAHPRPEPGHAKAAILQPPPLPVPQQAPLPDTEVGAKVRDRG